MARIYGLSASQQNLFYSQKSITQKNSLTVSGNRNGSGFSASSDEGVSFGGIAERLSEAQEEKDKMTKQMRRMIRDLARAQDEKQDPASVTEQDDTAEEEETKQPVRYNYKDVSSKIQRAKTSNSAGQAMLAAKRKVLEIKRKIMSGKGDPEELQSVLTHAKRMEMVARKKKHHLELEEMVANTKSRDERLEETEEAFSKLKQTLAQAGEEKVAIREDEIFDQRGEMLEDAAEDLGESGEATQEALTELNQMVAEFGEEELKQLEEAMEAFESIEALDPHMSDEQFEDLKRKHRAAENKAIVKADMDYLKDMAKLRSPSINLQV